MTQPDRRRANLLIGVAFAVLLGGGLGWMAFAQRLRIPTIPQAPDAPPVFDAEWIKLPTPEDVVRAYPPRARTEQLADRVMVEMRCVIAQGGGLTDCAIFHESLKGYGFAEAALALAGRFQVKTTARDGSSLVDLPITVPLGFDALYAPEPGKSRIG
jgi:hypothetical protein